MIIIYVKATGRDLELARQALSDVLFQLGTGQVSDQLLTDDASYGFKVKDDDPKE